MWKLSKLSGTAFSPGDGNKVTEVNSTDLYNHGSFDVT